jgi:transposase
MLKVSRRGFGRALKLALVRRMEAGESGTALAREFGIKREILYRWRDAVRDGGEEALRDGPGRPNGHVRHFVSYLHGINERLGANLS